MFFLRHRAGLKSITRGLRGQVLNVFSGRGTKTIPSWPHVDAIVELRSNIPISFFSFHHSFVEVFLLSLLTAHHILVVVDTPLILLPRPIPPRPSTRPRKYASDIASSHPLFLQRP